MPDFKQNYFQKRTKPKGPRSNNRITSPEVQVIGSDGGNLGILNLNDAINRAKDEGLDLISFNSTFFCFFFALLAFFGHRTYIYPYP